MKRLSLQWRITLLTVLLIGAACVSMKLLLCASGLHYMTPSAASFRITAAPPWKAIRRFSIRSLPE